NGRLLLDVLLPHPLHAERARLLPAPGRHRLPPRHRRRRDLIRVRLTTLRAPRHPPDHRRRRPHLRPSRVLALAHPPRRLLPRPPAPGPPDHVLRARLRLRRRQHRRERRGSTRQGRTGRRAGQHLDLARRRTRARHLLRHRHHPHRTPPC